jgi:hypothetical protein
MTLRDYIERARRAQVRHQKHVDTQLDISEEIPVQWATENEIEEERDEEINREFETLWRELNPVATHFYEGDPGDENDKRTWKVNKV